MFIYEETEDLRNKGWWKKSFPRNKRFKTKSRIPNLVLFPYVLTTVVVDKHSPGKDSQIFKDEKWRLAFIQEYHFEDFSVSVSSLFMKQDFILKLTLACWYLPSAHLYLLHRSHVIVFVFYIFLKINVFECRTCFTDSFIVPAL